MIEALFTVEGHEDHAEGVQRSDEHTQQHTHIGIASAGPMRLSHSFDEGVLAIEAGEERRTDQCQSTDQRSPIGDRHAMAQTAHLAHVLLMVHGDDDRTGSQEQQGLEEGMSHQVKDCRAIGRRAQCDGHITELRQSGISHDTLDVVADDAQKTHEQRRGRTDDQNGRQRRLGQLEQRRHARHHKDAGCDHGGSMDESRDGRRAFHGIGQPHM